MRRITTECPFCGRVSGDDAVVLSIVPCRNCFDEFVAPDVGAREIEFQVPVDVEVWRG